MAAMDIDLDSAPCAALSKELWHLFLFAPLDAPGRKLSKDRKMEIETLNSPSTQVLEEMASPNMFGLFSSSSGEFCLRVFDKEANEWLIKDIDPMDDYCVTMSAADRGLVCFVSENAHKRLRIVVMNPLTEKKYRLPRLLGIGRRRPTVQPTMLQLTVDRNTKHYKVFVVGYKEGEGRGLFAQVFDSRIKEWTVVGSGEQSWPWDRVFGCEYKWDEDDDVYTGERLDPIVYDFAEQTLKYYGGTIIVQAPYVKHYALLNDRLFVLHKETRPGPYCISEWHLPKNAPVWDKVRTHSCAPFDDVPERNHRLYLHACKGLLMVFVQVGDLLAGMFGLPASDVPHDKYHKGWLY